MRVSAPIAILFSLAVGVLVISPSLGMKFLWPFSFIPGSVEEELFWKIRLPRVLLGFLAGGTLALSGVVYQAVFRNPLADPYILGVAGGAAFGASLGVIIGSPPFFSSWLPFTSVLALAGALLSVFAVSFISSIHRRKSSETMLLAGVIVSFFFSSLLLFLQYISDFRESFLTMRWLMGSLEIVGFESVLRAFPFILFGSIMIATALIELDLLSVSEEFATTRGMNVRRSVMRFFIATSLMVGAIVSTCGPIGFIGVIVPHICRMILGAPHRITAPASFLVGGAFLVLCDVAARTVVAPAEIPVGIITALLGTPFFLWVLLSRR